ncbi:unnamed protein product [Caenorhabditis bovis]|uniref:Uncharacterized protein n=1 Tax=Caenorhabditis bovis TaxID=2654633 RepID=A0A8S1EWZ5_9PELO|nr:unnamed protein product [Caenorhabditis bovis]
MQFKHVVTFVAFVLIVQECNTLTVSDLFGRLKDRQREQDAIIEKALERNIASDTPLMVDKTYVRSVGTVAGRQIIPRRWTYGEKIDAISVDEDGVAIPVRARPSLSSILNRRFGN